MADLRDLLDKEKWNIAGRNLQAISEAMRADPTLAIGALSPVGMAGMLRVNSKQIAGLMSDAEKAMLQYELSKIPKKPALSLKDLAIGGGALAGGGMAGYYGIGAMTE